MVHSDVAGLEVSVSVFTSIFGIRQSLRFNRVWCAGPNVVMCATLANSTSLNVQAYPANIHSVGAKLRYMGYFASLLHPPPPQEEKVGYYFQSGTCLGA